MCSLPALNLGTAEAPADTLKMHASKEEELEGGVLRTWSAWQVGPALSGRDVFGARFCLA